MPLSTKHSRASRVGSLPRANNGNQQASYVDNRASRLGSVAQGRTGNRRASYQDNRVSASAACWDAPTSFTTPAGALLHAKIQARKAAAAQGSQVRLS